MFCQQCGAELRVGAGFCAICGAAAPQPKLHIDQPEKGKQKQPASAPARQPKAANNEQFSSALPSGAIVSSGHAGGSLIPTKAQPSYEAIRHASSYRGNTRHVAPVASLEVRSSAEPPAPKVAAPEAPPAVSAAPVQERAILAEQPEIAEPAQTTATAVGAPQYVVIGSQAPIVLSAASVVPLQPQLVQNGRHLNGHQQHVAAPRRAEAVPSGGSYTRQLIGATRGAHLPQDVPNRIVLGALVAMFLCFFLPWVIVGGGRDTPLSIGWPVALPLIVLAGAMLTIVMPERALYARFFLALPLGLGCFGLGSALLLFLLSSAVAANSVGASFLGVDIGFAFFVVAALALTIGGYYKLLRELPLFQSGQLRLAPLPGILRVLSERPAPGSAQPAAPAQQASTASKPVPLDQAG